VGSPKRQIPVFTRLIIIRVFTGFSLDRFLTSFCYLKRESEVEATMQLRKDNPAPGTSLAPKPIGGGGGGDTPIHAVSDTPLKGIRTNIVQSIRAFRVQDLQDAAIHLGQHFLYANLANALTKQDVLDMIGQQFMLPTHVGKNFDALYDSMTDPVHKSGPQPGFIAVLEHIPANLKFDKEAREQLLDIFRDAADYWGDRKIPFRCFYSFL
jgi:RNAse (barnase) inhibitor barstar